MNAIELTQLFVQYATLSEQLAVVKSKIEEEILILGESTKIAGVTATYYKPSNETPDYEKAARSYMESHPVPEKYLDEFSTPKIYTSWKDVCENLKIVPPPGEEKPARVVVK
jgi:hypothetical protein